LCVSGSIAAYKSIELARLLMRHGADVTCVASHAVTKLIKPDYFKWATGNEVVTKRSNHCLSFNCKYTWEISKWY